MTAYAPAYLKAYEDGTLQRKSDMAQQMLINCSLCPRRCKVDRTRDEVGFCETGHLAKVANFNAHFGEEAPLVGQNGSGTIFFSHCNLRCIFCQNYEISHQGSGQKVTSGSLAEIMLHLQHIGCHNINLVTPSHVVPQILAALLTAAENGLDLPIVYNTSAYDRVETLKLLDGVVDIYMPDFKFWDPLVAESYCAAKDYPEVAQRSILEMYRQVGDLFIETDGITLKGLLVRHLIIPHKLSETIKIMTFIAEKISTDTYLNLMSHYRPCGPAKRLAELNTTIDLQEYQHAVEVAGKLNLVRLDGDHPNLPFKGAGVKSTQ